MTIMQYRKDNRFRNCSNAFLVTGKRQDKGTDSHNRRLLRETKTGYWQIAEGRIRPGDAVFVLLPNQARHDGYPRELYAGVVAKVLPHSNNRTELVVQKFFRLADVPTRISAFLKGNTPPQGNTALQVWSAHQTRQSSDKKPPQGSMRPIAMPLVTTQFTRDPAVKAWVLEHANGKCESCNRPAPFIDSDGLPFLEVHHVRQFADNGTDTVTNAVALCPNCHREAHYGNNAKVLLSHLYERVARLVRE